MNKVKMPKIPKNRCVKCGEIKPLMPSGLCKDCIKKFIENQYGDYQ